MKTIVISAGHGGKDSGAVGNGLREKDANLAIALACRDYLNDNYEGHKLVLPRDRDVFVSLPARRDLTASVKADRYISIHNNAYSNPTANGFDTHLSTGPLYAATKRYRDFMHDTVYEYVKTLGVRDRGKKFTNHDVTRMMPCPTVVMEYMFVTNPREAELLKNPQVLKQLGIHTAIGVAKDLGLPRKQSAPTPPPQTDVWYRVFAGSWRTRAYAENAVEKLKRAGYDAFIEVRK
jgi:N-acetylmuramoyl-L-alanine amidase